MQTNGYYEGISVIGDWADTLSVAEDIRLCSGDPYDDIDGLGTDVEFFAITNDQLNDLNTYWNAPTQLQSSPGETAEGKLSAYYTLCEIASNKTHTVYCVFEKCLAWADCQFGKPCVRSEEGAHTLLHLLWENLDTMKNSFRWEA